MRLKKFYFNDIETISLGVERSWLEYIAFTIGKENLKELLILPKKILIEMRKFIRRNSLVIVAYDLKTKEPLHCFCKSCLKAYLIKKTREFALDKKYEISLNKIFREQTGHNGYFINGNKLFKINL